MKSKAQVTKARLHRAVQQIDLSQLAERPLLLSLYVASIVAIASVTLLLLIIFLRPSFHDTGILAVLLTVSTMAFIFSMLRLLDIGATPPSQRKEVLSRLMFVAAAPLLLWLSMAVLLCFGYRGLSMCLGLLLLSVSFLVVFMEGMPPKGWWTEHPWTVGNMARICLLIIYGMCINASGFGVIVFMHSWAILNSSDPLFLSYWPHTCWPHTWLIVFLFNLLFFKMEMKRDSFGGLPSVVFCAASAVATSLLFLGITISAQL